MNEIFIDNLPKKGKNIDWINTLGYIVPFEYNKIKGDVEIIGYEAPKVKILYKDDYFEVNTNSFLKCKFGRVVGRITDKFRYQIGENIKNVNADYVIIDKEYRIKKVKHKNGKEFKRKEKWYKYKCNKCCAELWVIEQSVKNGNMCGCCSNKFAILGINTIWDTDRWMCDLGVSEEDAKKYTYGNRAKVNVKCPNCGNVKSIFIRSVYKDKSIGCVCGDGVSYPEKFMYSILHQLKVDFIMQLSKRTLSWCKNYRYDFYIPNINAIIEVHGLQHYENTNFKKTLKEEQNNDKAKEDLALLNNISHYIAIDCRKSQLEFIKNNVLNSKLSNLFDFSIIDWNKCGEYASKSNKIIEVCNYWKNRSDNETVSDLAKIFGYSKKTISKYLNKGSKYGWCKYTATRKSRKSKEKLSREKIKSKNNYNNIEVFKDGISFGVFESCSELDRVSEEIFGVKMTCRGISRVARGERKHHKGYIFKYIHR